MVIDVHTHLALHNLYPKYFIKGLITKHGSIGDGFETSLESNVFLKFVTNLMNDSEGLKLIQQMNMAEIEKSILLIPDLGIYFKEDNRFSIENIYQAYHRVYQMHPDRFMLYGGVDPRRERKGVDLFEAGINQYKFKGLKLYPGSEFDYSNQWLLSLLDLCSHKKLNVLLHTGESIKGIGYAAHFAASIAILAGRYPSINFIMAHGICMQYREIIDVACMHPNIYIDLSAFQVHLSERDFVSTVLKEYLRKVPDKIMFGSDWPLFMLKGTQKKWVDLIVSLFNDDSKWLDYVLYKNAMICLSI